MRRWLIIANASISSTAPSRLTNWTSSALIAAPRPMRTSAGPPRGRTLAWDGPALRSSREQQLHQHPDHREQERGGQELGHAEDPHLRAQRFEQREQRAADRELAHQRR